MILDGVDRNKLIEILNISCHSVKIKNLWVYQNETDEPYLLRPTLHILMSCKAGAFKSERLFQLEKLYKSATHPVEWITGATPASIAGSIDPVTREVSKPISYKCKGGSLLIDEIDLNPETKRETIKELLPFLEYERTSRKVAISPKTAINDEVNQYNIDGGWIKFWGLRCNVIFATMLNYKRSTSSNFFEALLTRVTPIRWVTDNKEIENMIRKRDNIFHRVDFAPPENVIVKLEDFNKLTEELNKYGEYVTSKNYVRTLNDMIRCFAVLGKHDADLYKFVIMNRNWQRAIESEFNDVEE